MYYLAKLAQASGLAIVAFGFLISFPNLMKPKILLIGVSVFLFGLVIQKFMLSK